LRIILVANTAAVAEQQALPADAVLAAQKHGDTAAGGRQFPHFAIQSSA